MRKPTYKELVEWVTALEENADGLASNLTELRRRKAEKELIQSKKKLEQLYAQLITAREMERKRIAGELHDDLGQSLILLKLQLSVFQKKLPDGQKGLRKDVGGIMNYVDQIIENTRRLSHNLAPNLLEELGLSGALRALVDDFSKHSGKEISLEMLNIDAFFSPMATIIIYRIFQEILTNIERHAQASTVTIAVSKHRRNVIFQIQDDGRGFDTNRKTVTGDREAGLGLTGLDERVKMLGGRIAIYSQPAKGTHVDFILPLDARKVNNDHISCGARC